MDKIHTMGKMVTGTEPQAMGNKVNNMIKYFLRKTLHVLSLFFIKFFLLNYYFYNYFCKPEILITEYQTIEVYPKLSFTYYILDIFR